MPDHWVPLAVVGRTQHYPLTRVARLSGLAGAAHVLVSIVLGAVIVLVGLQFSTSVSDAQNTIVGLILIVTGIGFAVFELVRGGHAHPHPHEHTHSDRRHSLLAVVVPFGAAASPDLTILPVFLASTTAGVGTAIGSLVIFAAVTIGTIVGLTVFATAGGYQVRGAWLERWGNTFTAAVLVCIGALVLAGVI